MKTVLDSTRIVPPGGEFTFCDSTIGNYTMRGPGTYHIKMVEFGERRTATKQRRVRWKLGGRLIDPARRITSASGAGRRANDVADHRDRRVGNEFCAGDPYPFLIPFHRRKDDVSLVPPSPPMYGGRRSYDFQAGDRRVATTQRRARGHGADDGIRRGCKSWSSSGRRANDIADHQDRRVTNTRLWYQPFMGKPDWYRRRKGDDRRNKLATEFGYGGRRRFDREERRSNRYTYVKSMDPRIRALERRKS